MHGNMRGLTQQVAFPFEKRTLKIQRVSYFGIKRDPSEHCTHLFTNGRNSAGKQTQFNTIE
jgi:hypothetical protein